MRKANVTYSRIKERNWRKILAVVEALDYDLAKTLDPKLTEMEPEELEALKGKLCAIMDATQ